MMGFKNISSLIELIKPLMSTVPKGKPVHLRGGFRF